ncbi:hypothetical protein LTR91_003354 [Friedmanniomyces endolithicus]|uniref:WD40 repeat-like protein n=1 Tax=Friedmanniomyces endolithicus TaxID=329885 RepID=A0AAN6KY85_9PEZI|nr:hypothetical protein LTR57_008573 [Friedmanniomyces endolithicus]KAK0997122.1 hypothetical protein LTS01_006105 [Friedmanniomyces endolithicus]KAK1007824.1 hypothetical protein LTR91_003354 [Friedmanniomyces endolithicus]KAK1043287.1 hypothetical protein LTS16_008109 [Friedmanniomyces endolithicus]
MPTTRHVSSSLPHPSTSPDAVQFPTGQHLLIATPSHIYAWDTTGIRTVFTSGKSGIVAARARNDILAVADSQVVVLHDTKHGQDTSWGLTATGDEVRLLENTKDGLYLTTKLTNEILRYSTLRARVQSPLQAHNTAPVALACSSAYVVSASDNPPVIYLKNLAHSAPPIFIEPSASDAAVCIAVFHPARDNVFLLGFKDGTIAAYNANEVTRGGFDGEIGHLKGVHHGVTGCTFLDGAKARAVSVGSDARCRLMDLESGVVIRTWHARAPVTSVCASDGMIAVARVDGKVHLYDCVGVLQAQQAVGSERTISVEWVKGPTPPAIAARSTQYPSDAPSLPTHSVATEEQQPELHVCSGPVKTQLTPQTTAKPRKRSEQVAGLGLPAGLRRPVTTPQAAGPNKSFAVHPDEIEEGTVRHTPAAHPEASRPRPGDLLDLFSPVKPAGEAKDFGTPEKRPATSPRSRPPISTQTFMKSPVLGPRDSHATSSGSETARQVETSASAKLARIRRASTHASPIKKRQISFQPVRKPRGKAARSSSTLDGAQPAPPNENAKVLAGLRQMSTARPDQGSMLGPFAGKKAGKASIAPTPVKAPATKPQRGVGRQKYWLPGNVLERESTWPTDSVQDSPVHEAEQDIWLTDESDKEAKNLRRRRMVPVATRPPARQTSRSRVDSGGTHSTVHPPARQNALPPSQRLDGSTGDSAFDTAYTHLSPTGAFSPASQHVRELFPRSSSLSPARKAAARRLKSPWDRAKASKSRPTPASRTSPPAKVKSIDLVRSPRTGCFECAGANTRISSLEDEVARLKGEVLAMKAVLRKNGFLGSTSMPKGPAARARLL